MQVVDCISDKFDVRKSFQSGTDFVTFSIFAIYEYLPDYNCPVTGYYCNTHNMTQVSFGVIERG